MGHAVKPEWIHFQMFLKEWATSNVSHNALISVLCIAIWNIKTYRQLSWWSPMWGCIDHTLFFPKKHYSFFLHFKEKGEYDSRRSFSGGFVIAFQLNLLQKIVALFHFRILICCHIICNDSMLCMNMFVTLFTYLWLSFHYHSCWWMFSV